MRQRNDMARWRAANPERERDAQHRHRASQVARNLASGLNREGKPWALPPSDPPGRVLRRTSFTETCWLWTGTTDADGYGRLGGHMAKDRMVHRVLYEALEGPIPAGLTIDHLCFVTTCVNPDHLEPVSRAENARRMQARRHELRQETFI